VRRVDESGQVTAFVVVFMVALIAIAGLVIDGGVALSAQRRAINEAQAAARAGAQALDTHAYRRGETSTLRVDEAEQASRDYMARAHPAATVTSAATTAGVTVDVTFQQPLNILGVFGFDSITARGHGSARSAHGVSREND
jgi:hypothetical protein